MYPKKIRRDEIHTPRSLPLPPIRPFHPSFRLRLFLPFPSRVWSHRHLPQFRLTLTRAPGLDHTGRRNNTSQGPPLPSLTHQPQSYTSPILLETRSRVPSSSNPSNTMPAGPANGRANRGGNSKNATQSLIIRLKMSPRVLREIASDTPEQSTPNDAVADKGADRSSPASSTEVPVVRPSSADNASDADATSTPANGATPGDTPRRKGVPGPKPGNKRTNGQTEAAGRARGRPGPKKKPKT